MELCVFIVIHLLRNVRLEMGLLESANHCLNCLLDDLKLTLG